MELKKCRCGCLPISKEEVYQDYETFVDVIFYYECPKCKKQSKKIGTRKGGNLLPMPSESEIKKAIQDYEKKKEHIFVDLKYHWNDIAEFPI